MSIAPGWPSTAPSAAPGYGWGASLAEVVTKISLGGFVFATSERAARMSSGAAIVVAELDGWYQSPRDRTERQPHPSGIGTMSGLRSTSGRSITVRGWIRGRTVPDVEEAKDMLGALDGTFVVDERARVVARETTVSNTAFAPDRITPLFETFALALYADDPLRYSTAQVDLVNGANVLVNSGDRDAWPVIEFVGPHNAVSMVHAGGTYQLTALASGVERTVDLRNGDVWQGGVRVFGAESGPASVIPAGGGDLTVSGLGAGAARVRRFEAWS